MNRSVFVLLILAIIVSTSGRSDGQQTDNAKCTLTVANSPAIRSVRLGMTSEQLLTLFPGSPEDNNVQLSLGSANGYPHFGVARLSFSSSQYPALKERFAGIDYFAITLFDNRVTEILVQYIAPSASGFGVNWRSEEEFITKVAEALHLPAASNWEAGSSETLHCNGFEITARASDGGQIALRDASYLAKVKERQKADEERRKREFKP